MKYAVIDVGSNTIRLVIYLVDGTNFHPMFTQKFTVGLAAYHFNGNLTQEGINQSCLILQECRALLQQFKPQETMVFATASLRGLQNTQEVIDQIFLLTGFTVDVLSGQEEAYLDYYGVMQELPMENGLIFDIGGGSTELITFAHDGPGVIESLSFGSLSLSKTYVEKLFPRKKERDAIRERVQKELKKRKLHHLPSYPMLCGIGGTARTVLLLIQAQQKQGNNSDRTITVKQFLTLRKFLWKKDTAARDLLLQVCPDRLHTIFPGILIMEALIQQTQCESIYISNGGVREGYLRRKLALAQKEQKNKDID